MITFDYSNLEKKTLENSEGTIEYWIVEEGNGVIPKSRLFIIADYTGTLLDGTVFDSSYSRGKPLQTMLGQGRLIRGWEIFFMNISVGTKAVVKIPAHLAYGDQSPFASIPPNSDLIFHIELIDDVCVMDFKSNELIEMQRLMEFTENNELKRKFQMNFEYVTN